MPAATPAAGEPPRRPGRIPPTPPDVWDRFLTDTEERIRVSAPKEPSARDRLAAARALGARQPAPERRRFAPGRRHVRPVLVLLLLAALALLTFRPATALSWVDGVLGRPAAAARCAPGRAPAGCRAGELPRNSRLQDPENAGGASQATLS